MKRMRIPWKLRETRGARARTRPACPANQQSARFRKPTLWGFLGFLVFAAAVAQAQPAFPSKPIRVVVGFAPSGPTDILARVLASGMGKSLGEAVVVENRTGASGNIATDAVARAEPDGHTLLALTFSNAVNESLFKDFKTRVATHFEPIAYVAETGLVVIVHPSLDVRSPADLVRLEKTKPGSLFYATAGAGTATHLAAELFNYAAGTKLQPVHYKGGGDTIKDLLSGEVKIMFATIPAVISLVREGKLRGIATTGGKRDPNFPDLPTLVESGVAGAEVSLWAGFAAPKRTPKPVIDKLVGALKAAVAMPEVREAMAKQGFAPVDMGPQEFGAYFEKEAAKWAKVVDAMGLARGN